MAGPPTVIIATIGMSVTMVSRVARFRSASTAGPSSAAALRDSRGMTTVSTVTPMMPNGSCRISQV